MRFFTALLSTSILLVALVSQASAEPPGLISNWKFDEGTGTTATDSFGTHHGALTNNPQWTASPINGALLFGPNNYVDVAHSDVFDFGGGLDYFSIEAWVFRTADVISGVVAKARLSPFEGWGFATYEDGRLSFSGIGFWEVVTYGPNTVPRDEWTHVAVTRNDTGYKLYINGVSVPYYGSGGTWGNHSGNLRIGTDYINQFFWQGKIDEVAIFNRGLSALEVLDHYENGLRGPVVIVDNEWRQVTDTMGFTWAQIATVCSATTGQCSGSIDGVDFSGWTWASAVEVGDLFHALTPHLGGVTVYSFFDADLQPWMNDWFNLYFAPTFSSPPQPAYAGYPTTFTLGLTRDQYAPHVQKAFRNNIWEQYAWGAWTNISWGVGVGQGVWLHRDPSGPNPDGDGDGVLDVDDNCPSIANPDQIDTDMDGLGDACDADLDDVIVLSADNDIAADLTSAHYNTANFPGDTAMLFENILQGGSTVLVDPSNVSSALQASWEVQDFYSGLAGVTASTLAGDFTSADLIGVDLLVSLLPDAPYTTDELAAMDSFLDAGGTIFFLGDGALFQVNNSYINDALDYLGSSMRLEATANSANTATTSIASHPLTAGVSDFGIWYFGSISGATPLAYFNSDVVLAVDDGTAGEPCDSMGGDVDGDMVCGNVDNCPADINPDQEDWDGDLEGDACDTDDDNDGIPDSGDNCQFNPNPSQEDEDGDGAGDQCDADIDGDGVLNNGDNCSLAPNPFQEDLDGDGFGDACDADDDGDEILDEDDNCPVTVNAGQEDLDGDGIGDDCDADVDGDGIDNDGDNCPNIANSSQTDWDVDGLGDACDGDIDNDGVGNSYDVCAHTPLGEIVDTNNGCSVAQLCPCEGPRGTTTPWKNHGKYVSCTAHASEDFVNQGLITETEKDAIMSEAGNSNCGHKN